MVALLRYKSTQNSKIEVIFWGPCTLSPEEVTDMCST